MDHYGDFQLRSVRDFQSVTFVTLLQFGVPVAPQSPSGTLFPREKCCFPAVFLSPTSRRPEIWTSIFPPGHSHREGNAQVNRRLRATFKKFAPHIWAPHRHKHAPLEAHRSHLATPPSPSRALLFVVRNDDRRFPSLSIFMPTSHIVITDDENTHTHATSECQPEQHRAENFTSL